MGKAPQPGADGPPERPQGGPHERPYDRQEEGWQGGPQEGPAAPLPEPLPQLPPGLDRLRRLVTLLVVTMIGGFLVIVALFVIRLGTPGAAPPALSLPQSVQLPEGAQPEAVTLARRWVLVLSTDQRLFLYDRETGALRHELPLPN